LFFHTNLDCHSNRSNGLVEPEAVVGAPCGAGYSSNMICLGQRRRSQAGGMDLGGRRVPHE
jgi:hypothetical protein